MRKSKQIQPDIRILEIKTTFQAQEPMSDGLHKNLAGRLLTINEPYRTTLSVKRALKKMRRVL